MSPVLDIEIIRKSLNAAEQGERRQKLMELFIGEDPAVAVLISDYLGDPFPAVSEAAVEALARCENSIAAEAAVPHLRSSEPSERGYALEALVRLGRYALPSLTLLLADPDHNMRKFATDAMANIRAPESIPTLLEAIQSGDTMIAAAAAEALGMLDALEAVPVLGEAVVQGPDWLRISALASLGEIGGEEALTYICQIPPDSPTFVQAAAANAISRAAERGSTAAYSFLTSLLNPKKPALEEEIVKTLGHWIANERLSSNEANDLINIFIPFRLAIDTCLNSRDPQVRAAAVTCLCVVEDFEKTRILQMFADNEVVVRLAVLNTLAFHSVMSPEELAHIAMNEQEEDVIRITALHSLANILQYKVSIDNLIMDGLIRLVYTAYQPSIRAAAMRELLLSGASERNASAVAQFTEEEFASDDAVLTELMDCPANVLLPVAMKGLEDVNPDVRWRTFTTLVQPERALEFTRLLDGQALVTATLCDDDWRIRVHAVSILGKCADQAWARKLLYNACESLDDRVRVRAVDALGSAEASQDSVEIFRAHLSDASERVRTAAFRSLGRLGPFEDGILRRALLDPYPPLQHAALVALLASDLNLNSLSLWSEAEQITSQSTDLEISELAAEIRLRLIQC